VNESMETDPDGDQAHEFYDEKGARLHFRKRRS
jgi:hypothetical protein